MMVARSIRLVDDDVIAGLRGPLKRLPTRLLYDERGSQLFERISQLDEYYLTRTELVLLRTHLPAIAAEIGPRARIVEPGAGAPTKARMLLAALMSPAVYVPIEVCPEQLAATVALVHREYPKLEILPVCSDYSSGVRIPNAKTAFDRTLIFFPGSTLGNFEPVDALAFLTRIGELAGKGGSLLLGTDSTDDVDLLLRAYDDEGGVTAEFDRNVLVHVNRVERASFDPDAFLHRALWDPIKRRVEMHLVSRRDQTVNVDGRAIRFERGEPIITEHSYKHDPDTLAAMLGHAGWNVRRVFVDDVHEMRLWLCER